ncbi:alpha-tocopherol transfer protein-like [Periplaneta americana]|uniref:alpha-tocopherol transfer protein-like n=1 Tax=Periplaneta americana TaxID=6978 RepID=UPI0037E98B01
MPPISAQEELSRNSNLKKENIDYLREWMSKQPHLPSGVTDEQLILFLNCCQHSLEACKQTIEAYYTIRTHAPELFGNRDPQSREIQQALSIFEIGLMPKTDKHGNLILFVRLSDFDANKYYCDDFLKIFFMVQDLILLEKGAVHGLIFVVDMKGISIGHLTRVKLSSLKKYYMYIQDAFPGKVLCTHLINASSVTETFMNMSKPFLTKDLVEKMLVHTTMGTLYEYIPKEALPKEYGGELESVTHYNQEMRPLVEEYRDWFEKEEVFRVDESKRQGRAKNAGDVFGVEGSFKKLDID